MSGRTAGATALVLGTLGAACARAEAPREVAVVAADTLVTLESGLIGSAADLAVDERGDVYVLDQFLHHVLVVPAAGGATRTIARRGAGPGEMNGPVALAAGGGVVRVADLGNARIHTFARDGRSLGAERVSERTLGAHMALSPDGRTAYATLGLRDEALARLTDAHGRDGPGIGRRSGRADEVLDFSRLKAQIARGDVPREMRNHARPLLAPDGGAWLVLLAEPAVARYGPDGEERWTRRLEVPETRAIRERFFRTNARIKSPSAYFPLSYVADVVAEPDGRLWVLLNTGRDGPGVLLVVGPDGGLPYRVVLPRVAGARQVAVDRARGRVYLALSTAELVSIRLPRELAA